MSVSVKASKLIVYTAIIATMPSSSTTNTEIVPILIVSALIGRGPHWHIAIYEELEKVQKII